MERIDKQSGIWTIHNRWLFFFGVVYDRKREVSRNKLDRSGITVSWLLYATMAHEAAVSGSDMESAGRQEWTRSMP